MVGRQNSVAHLQKVYLLANVFDEYTGIGLDGFAQKDEYLLEEGNLDPNAYFATVLKNNGYQPKTAEIELVGRRSLYFSPEKNSSFQLEQ